MTAVPDPSLGRHPADPIDPLLRVGPPAGFAPMSRARREPATSFEAFYVLARPSVGRALAVTLRDDDLASDAVDEALVRAYQRWPRVSGLDKPEAWVYRVGLNYATSRLRRRRRPVGDAEREAVHDAPVADPAVAAALDGLSVDQRAVVVCRHLLGWSEAQTAAALGLRPGTVKSRLARALAQLARSLDHLDPEDRS